MKLVDYVQEKTEGFCPNFDPAPHLCGKYEDRPNVCRAYPFIIRKIGDKYILGVHSRCKGIGKGPEVDIERKVLELVKYCEEELDIEFIISREEDGSFSMYRIK